MLAYVHARGVVHGDLKPGNVMLTEAGLLVLLDFGIAAPIGADSLTRSGTVLGTPTYMAPETITGDRRGPAGDVFALGVMAYELLCGVPPFKGASFPNMLLRILYEKPEPPSKLNPAVPRKLDEIVLEALQKEPERRPSANELADALRRLTASDEWSSDAPLLSSPAASASFGHAEPIMPELAVTMEVVRPDQLPDEAARLLERSDVAGVLLTTAGAGRGTFHAISGDVTIGRAPDCELRLDAQSVSKRHTRLHVAGDVVTVRDCGSANGTYVNAIRVCESVRLEHGDELRVGGVTLLFLQRRSAEAMAARRRMAALDARWQRLIDAAPEGGGTRFVEESRRLLDELLREAIGFRVEREVPLHRGIVGFLVEAPMLWIRHTRFPILFLRQDDDPELIDRLAEFLQTGQLLGYFVVLVAMPSPAGASDTRTLRERINGSPYRYDFVVLDREQLAALVTANEARRFVEMILEQGTDPGSLSPYVVRGPVPENMFFGREREVKTLTQGIGARSFAVVAGRRMGKSSILLRVQRALASDPRYEPIYLSCEDRPTWAEFLAMLGGEDDAGGAAEDPALVRPRIAARRERAGGRTIVFLLDEIDALLAHDVARGGRLFRTLRAVAHEAHCRFVFSGSRTLYQKLHDPASPFFNFCEELLLRPLDDKAVEAIVRKPMQQLGFDLPDPERLVAEIIRVTSSHPNLVQIVCQQLVAGSLDRRVAAAEVERIAAQRELQRDFVETAWSDTTPFERIVSLLSVGPTFSLAALQAEARRRGLSDEGRVVEALEMLDLYSLVAPDGDAYRFAMAVYPAMVRRSHNVEALIAGLARRVAG